MDVAFRFASRFEQCIHGGALVNVFSQQSPPFLLVQPDRVIRKFWCVDQGDEIGTCIGVVKADSQGSDVCTEVIMRTLNGLLLRGFCRRWREGTTSMMAQGFDGAFETWSSIWDTSA